MYGLCMWGYTCTRVWMYAFACMHVEVEEDIKYFLLLPSCCLDTGSPTNLKFTILARLVAQKISRIHLSLLLDADVTCMHSNVCVFV